MLRQFTDDDVDILVELDGDPDVMHFVTGGRPTPRAEIETDVPPASLAYYASFAGYGFWAAIEKSSGSRWWCASRRGDVRPHGTQTTSSTGTSSAKALKSVVNRSPSRRTWSHRWHHSP